MNFKVITLSEKEMLVSKNCVLFHSNSMSFSGTQNRSVVGVRQGCNREEALVISVRMMLYHGCSHGSMRLFMDLEFMKIHLAKR